MSKNNQGLSVIVAEERHLDEMVQCHIKAFPGEFMTLIGARFIKDFYKFHMSHEDGIVFVALGSSGKVVGLVAGGKPELREQFSRRRVPLYVLDIAFSAITSNYARRRLLQHMCSAIKKILTKLGLTADNAVKVEPLPDPPGTWSSLLSICTDPEFCDRGVGKLLMQTFRAESMARGYKTMRLSVHPDNNAAIALYKRCGWKIILESPRGLYFKRSVEE